MFWEAIYRLGSSEEVKTILEIGSSSGVGSTQAFVKGIHVNPLHPTLFCIELSKERFALLQQHYANDPSVVCYNASSVPVEMFPSQEQVTLFHKTGQSTKFSSCPLNTLLGWLRKDLEYLESSGLPQHGIEIVKAEHAIQDFDMVLIDGSEFTGMAEFSQIYGARFILLDDIDTFKNFANYHQLLEDRAYVLLEENHELRNGYAIFKRVEGASQDAATVLGLQTGR